MEEALISVDIEADGPIPGKYSMLSIGAVNVFSPGQIFYMEFKPISSIYVPEALAVAAPALTSAKPGEPPHFSRNRLYESGEWPETGIPQFCAWAAEQGRPVFCSFSTWDWSFVYWYMIEFQAQNPFGHSSLDMKSFYAGRYLSYSLSMWKDTAKGNIKKRNPQLLGDSPHTHNALDDAKEQAQFMRKMLRR